MTHQVFIASYRKDFPWLVHCIDSLDRRSHNFNTPVVAVPESDLQECRALLGDKAVVKPRPDVPGHGFKSAQQAMLEADLYCPADFIYLVGSDCFFYKTFEPQPFFYNQELPIMLVTPYRELANHPGVQLWKTCVQNAFGFDPYYEFMRRLPIVYPSGLFGLFRSHIAARHRTTFRSWLAAQDIKSLSESNLLGAFAHAYYAGMYRWIDTTIAPFEDVGLIQFWSHHPGGIEGHFPEGPRVIEGTKLHSAGEVIRWANSR